MIKLIVFDLVGVLVTEKDIELTEVEDKLERLFGPNLSDAEYLINARKIIDKDSILMRTTEQLLNKIYTVKDKKIFKKIKEENKDLKIIIATNHVSYIRDYIENNLEVERLEDLIISAEIGKIKPNKDFYDHIINKFNIEASEILFLDDNKNNIETANKLGIQTILVNSDMKIYDEIIKFI